MKYMTKEWYETMQNTSFDLTLRITKNAEVFSEDYFRKLYKSEEKKWLREREEESNMKFEDFYPEELPEEYCQSLEPSELEQAEKEYFEMREYDRINYVPPIYDPEKEKEVFKKVFANYMKHFKSLPDSILQKVADIRVLALNRVSSDVKKDITAYCRANEKAADEAAKAYLKEHKKLFKKGLPAFVEDFNFHDCDVISCRKKGKDIVLKLDNAGGFTSISQITFKNCTILKQDAPLNGAWWLYDEIYKGNDGFEIHVLLTKNDKLVDFIVTTTDVMYR